MTKPMTNPTSHGLHRARTEATRQLLMDTAERLFAEHGIAEVSNRQITEAAGQSNNSVIAYHFGGKTDLILAISRAHAEPMEHRREELVAAAHGSSELRDHIGGLVRPFTEHLATLGSSSWCARFAAQVTTDPSLRDTVVWENTASPAMRTILAAIRDLTAHVPLSAAITRSQMARSAVVHTCAEREAAFNQLDPHAAAEAWLRTGDELVDALTGLTTAPVHPS